MNVLGADRRTILEDLVAITLLANEYRVETKVSGAGRQCQINYGGQLSRKSNAGEGADLLPGTRER
jgi:hypothetical protein